MKVFFAGYCGSGKTTAARYIATRHTLEMCSEGKALRAVAELVTGRKDRGILQDIGEGIRQILGPTCWLDVILRDNPQRATIDDVRHPEDLHKLLMQGWIGVWIDSPQEVRYERLRKRDGEGVDLTLTERRSEHLLDTWKWAFNHVVVNNGTIEQFYEKLDKLFPVEIKPICHICNSDKKVFKTPGGGWSCSGCWQAVDYDDEKSPSTCANYNESCKAEVLPTFCSICYEYQPKGEGTE